MFCSFLAIWLVFKGKKPTLLNKSDDAVVVQDLDNDSKRSNKSHLIFGSYFTGPKDRKKVNSVEVPPFRAPLSKRNKQEQARFLSISKLEADFPGDFEYLYFDDIAEDTVLIEGVLREEGAYMATVATKKILNPDEILPTLKQNPDILPGLNESFSWLDVNQESTKLSKLPSGISEAHYWLSSNKGKSVALVYGKRVDQKGSYVFLVHGPQGYIDANEGKFEKYLMSFKPQN